MHQAIRLKIPASSPPNLEKALRVLEREGFNIVAVGGSDHEMGGEFSFAVPHGKEEGACDALAKAGYDDAHIVDVYTEYLDDRPGAPAAAAHDRPHGGPPHQLPPKRGAYRGDRRAPAGPQPARSATTAASNRFAAP